NPNIESVADAIVAKANETHARLRSANDFYRRLWIGDLSRDEYAAWLVQLHRYIRHTERGERGLSIAMAARKDFPGARLVSISAARAVEEEQGHDDYLIADLAALWNVSNDEARGRLERAPTAPSVLLWGEILDAVLVNCPAGVIGIALALETIASNEADVVHAGLLATRRIEGIDRAVSFLAAHTSELESDHTSAGRMRCQALGSSFDRNAAFFVAGASLAMYEGIYQFLAEEFQAARTPELVGGVA
ncbi:MAG TPA: hypothetical protein VFF73_06680, partial [Planctomycetota bacterium]|nr:hypothetical protein [Planctomycetota bacterium]